MRRSGIFLVEGVVALCVALMVGLALVTMLVMLHRFQARTSFDQTAQGILDSSLSQILSSGKPSDGGEIQVDGTSYLWQGSVEKSGGSSVAIVTVRWKEQKISGKRMLSP